eukprot:9408072-Lingulodinium_polyedra.AAC.1
MRATERFSQLGITNVGPNTTILGGLGGGRGHGAGRVTHKDRRGPVVEGEPSQDRPSPNRTKDQDAGKRRL